MSKEVPAFLRAEIGNDATDPAQEAWDRVLGRLAQMRLEFAEGEFDRIEVGRILRKIDQGRARCFDRLCDAGDLMDRQIIHEHDLAALEGWDQALLHISKKYRAVHDSLDHERCGHSASPQAATKVIVF